MMTQAGEISPWLRTLAALGKDMPSSIPNIHKIAHPYQ